MPKAECDRIAAKAGNNLAIYEKELGFEEGPFQQGMEWSDLMSQTLKN